MKSQLQTIVVLAITVSVTPARGQPSGREALVRVTEVVQREIAPSQSFVGTVYPLRKSTVGSTEEGRVEKFLVKEGDSVTEGQVLAQLRTVGLGFEKRQAEEEEVLRQKELDELEEGSRPEEKAEASATLQRDKALMDYAEARFRRAETLIKDRSVSQEEFDEAVSAAAAARHTYLASQARYDLVVKGPREEQIDQARARQKAQNQVVKRIEDKIQERTICAPFAGYVSAEHTQKGQWVGKGDPIADVVDLSYVEIKVSVPERAIPHVRTGEKAEVRIEALPGEKIPPGIVVRIVPQADVRSRTFPVFVQVENPERGARGRPLKAGMLAWATLVREPVQATLVPKDALVLDEKKAPTIFVVRLRPTEENPSQKIAEEVPVTIDVADGGLIRVIGDVAADELVVVEGNERLLDGQAVRIVD